MVAAGMETPLEAIRLQIVSTTGVDSWESGALTWTGVDSSILREYGPCRRKSCAINWLRELASRVRIPEPPPISLGTNNLAKPAARMSGELFPEESDLFLRRRFHAREDQHLVRQAGTADLDRRHSRIQFGKFG